MKKVEVEIEVNKTEGVKFPVPESYTPPSDVSEDQEFEALASFKYDKDGNMYLTKVEGVDVTGDSEKEDEVKSEEVDMPIEEMARRDMKMMGGESYA